MFWRPRCLTATVIRLVRPTVAEGRFSVLLPYCDGARSRKEECLLYCFGSPRPSLYDELRRCFAIQWIVELVEDTRW